LKDPAVFLHWSNVSKTYFEKSGFLSGDQKENGKTDGNGSNNRNGGVNGNRGGNGKRV
jgi:hypothetical protein